mmetsp:Transcript_28418/g.71509  ORF Transcript_28418/g.71509 Transcript_28418/m.71509 type:complete len:269 (+) Transcript_28418:635-1441(+)
MSGTRRLLLDQAKQQGMFLAAAKAMQQAVAQQTAAQQEAAKQQTAAQLTAAEKEKGRLRQRRRRPRCCETRSWRRWRRRWRRNWQLRRRPRTDSAKPLLPRQQTRRSSSQPTWQRRRQPMWRRRKRRRRRRQRWWKRPPLCLSLRPRHDPPQPHRTTTTCRHAPQHAPHFPAPRRRRTSSRTSRRAHHLRHRRNRSRRPRRAHNLRHRRRQPSRPSRRTQNLRHRRSNRSRILRIPGLVLHFDSPRPDDSPSRTWHPRACFGIAMGSR